MFYLHIGCHRGTFISRDSEVRKFDALEEAEKSYQESHDFWKSIGYVVWFANVKDDNGNVIKSWPGHSNYS